MKSARKWTQREIQEAAKRLHEKLKQDIAKRQRHSVLSPVDQLLRQQEEYHRLQRRIQGDG